MPDLPPIQVEYIGYAPLQIKNPTLQELKGLAFLAKDLAGILRKHWALDVLCTHHPQQTANNLLDDCLSICRSFESEFWRWLGSQTQLLIDPDPRGRTLEFDGCTVYAVADCDYVKVIITPDYSYWGDIVKACFDSLREVLALIKWHFHRERTHEFHTFKWDPQEFGSNIHLFMLTGIRWWYNVSGFLPTGDSTSPPKPHDFELLAQALEIHAERMFDALAKRCHTQELAPNPSKPKSPVGRPGKSTIPINTRIVELVLKEPHVKGLTARQWAQKLKCHHTSIIATEAWKKLKIARMELRLERTRDRFKRISKRKRAD